MNYPKFFMHGAYIQYVHFRVNDNGGQIINERRFEGCLYKVLPELENFGSADFPGWQGG